jgi:hypothetical protein
MQMMISIGSARLLAMAAVLWCTQTDPVSSAETQGKPGSDWKALRQQAVNRTRRIIFNNDGNEPVVFCKSVDKDELLALRTRDLVGTQVDSIFYCTWSSGFSLFTHRTGVGQVFGTREGRFTNNLAPAFLDHGIDPLQVMVEFGHKRGIEVFWSMRMNDTHDGSRTDYGPVMFRANQLKAQHPEYLIGSAAQRPQYGVWSAVDYGLPQIRDLASAFCKEVCENYDVDGIELDFFRHAFFFKCSAENQPCGASELDAMTGLLRRIRAITEELGRRRGRPILLAIRVPDSVDYCRMIGLDLEKWLSEGLTDLLIVTGYTQLNPWEYSVRLAHKHGVKVYPSLDEPRVRDPEAQRTRASLESYRGRALQAWTAGMDGIYMFNFFDPKSPLWSELGDADVLRKLDRNYFLSPRGVGSMYVPHQQFMHVPVLNPASPVPLVPGRTVELALSLGEGSTPQPGLLRLQFKALKAPSDLGVRWNKNELKSPSQTGVWTQYLIPASWIRQDNTIELTLPESSHQRASLADLCVSFSHDSAR